MDHYETLHAFLKESSMARHQRTETTMGGIGLANPVEYVSFLRVQATGVNALEEALSRYKADFDRAGISWASRSDALESDLAAMGRRWDRMPAPDLPTFDHALGAAYTLEGSRLGNAMLSRQMKVDHPDLAEKASAFLSFPTTPGFWREFMDKMNAEGADRARWPNILAGSLIAFDVFQHSAEQEIQHLAAS